MNTRVDQHYLVHLDLLADTFDPNDAVLAVMTALERLGGLGNFTYSVEEIEIGLPSTIGAVRTDLVRASSHGHGERTGGDAETRRFQGEYLG